MYKVGDIIKCKITGFKEYGIFVKMDDKYNGLIHISEISDSFVQNVADYGEVGEEIYAEILQIDEDTKQIKLSIKNIHYQLDGEYKEQSDKNGFLPVREHLNVWINEKLNEMNDKK